MTTSPSAYTDLTSWRLAQEVLAGAKAAIRYNKAVASSLILAVIHDHLLATSRAHALRHEIDVTLPALNAACADLPCSQADVYEVLARAIEIADAEDPAEDALKAAIDLVEYAFRRLQPLRCIPGLHCRAA